MSTTPDLSTLSVMVGENCPMNWSALAYAREHCPVFYTEAHGVHVVTTYAEARYVLEHPELFSSADPNVEGALPVRLPPLDTDPPRQQEIRRILNPFFSRSYFSRLDADIRAIAGRVIDRFADAGGCEFVHDFALPFNSAVLAQLVFNETDADRLARAVTLVSAVAEGLDPQAFAAVYGLVAEYLADRAGAADRRDDIIGAILAARIDGAPLADAERTGIVTALFLGGLNTTHGAMSNIMVHLATRPELEARLRDPRWARHDLEEFIRYESPVMVMARTVVREVELGGVTLKAGDRLAVHFASANRDERKFDRADELRFDRDYAGHAGFGLGIHRCVGMHLARYQVEIAFHELLSRFTRFRLEPGAHIRPAKGVVLAPEEVRVRFDRR
jgi:cytochrome P450